ncbi:GNAT family N-acetyltransferase [Roseburia intestinalis]
MYEIGYGFLDQYQGKGYAKESLLAIFDYMKKQGVKKYMPEQQKIISLLLDYLTVLVFNWLEQSGFRFIKTVKEMIFILKVEIL